MFEEPEIWNSPQMYESPTAIQWRAGYQVSILNANLFYWHLYHVTISESIFSFPNCELVYYCILFRDSRNNLWGVCVT